MMPRVGETTIRDHGGNIDWARSRFGARGASDRPWIDLSTGINRVPYPVPALPPSAFTALPDQGANEALLAVARAAYRTDQAICALAGAQAAIQLVPRLCRPGRARVFGPTYNEHAAALRANGWDVAEVTTLAGLGGADLAVVVNPNNPDGQVHGREALRALVGDVGRLIVDESFADATPEVSVASGTGSKGVLVLRSLGKFYGLAGVRLGFAIGSEDDIAALVEMAGPWAVSGPAIEIGRTALADGVWAAATTARLMADVGRLDAITAVAGWRLIGGTALFRLYETADAEAARAALASHQIWARIFPTSARRLRLGLPGSDVEWERLAEAMAAVRPA